MCCAGGIAHVLVLPAGGASTDSCLQADLGHQPPTSPVGRALSRHGGASSGRPLHSCKHLQQLSANPHYHFNNDKSMQLEVSAGLHMDFISRFSASCRKPVGMLGKSKPMRLAAMYRDMLALGISSLQLSELILLLQMEFQQRSQFSNVMSFRYMQGPVVTILVSKNAGRYRVRSDSFEAMWLIVQVWSAPCVLHACWRSPCNAGKAVHKASIAQIMTLCITAGMQSCMAV